MFQAPFNGAKDDSKTTIATRLRAEALEAIAIKLEGQRSLAEPLSLKRSVKHSKPARWKRPGAASADDRGRRPGGSRAESLTSMCNPQGCTRKHVLDFQHPQANLQREV